MRQGLVLRQERADLEQGQAVPDVGQPDLDLLHGAVGLGELHAGVALEALLVQHSHHLLCWVLGPALTLLSSHGTWASHLFLWCNSA